MPQIWHWLIIDGYKSHAVPYWLRNYLVEDLRARNDIKERGELTISEEHTTVKVAIDEPGMICVDRPWMSFQIDGLAVEIPCEDVALFRSQLEGLKPRFFKHYEPGQKIDNTDFVAEGKASEGVTYYKLHGFCKCIVLSPYDRYDLLEALKAKEQEADAQAAAFYTDRMTPSEALRAANAVANNIPIEEVPDCGANRQDRFKDMLGKKGNA